MASSLARDCDTAAEVKQAEWVLGAVDPQLLPGPSPVPQALVALKPSLFPPELEGSLERFLMEVCVVASGSASS